MGRKQILFVLILTLLTILANRTTRVNVLAQSTLTVHNIDTGLDYDTIQKAIDAPETADWHTILVDEGTYYEYVTVDKAVNLAGANQNTTVIVSNGTEQVISVTASGARISGFTVRNATWGIDLHYVQNATVTDNSVINCSYRGIFLYDCSHSIIANNTVNLTNPEGIEIWSGIDLWNSQEITIINNTVSGTAHGIYVVNNSTGNTISNNFLTSNPQGIILSINCNDNLIIENTVTQSDIGAIAMGGNYNNTIYHNNIINNPKPFFSYSGAINRWDNSEEGNYWDDYTKADLNEDGIGEAPYTIDQNNQDNHPLMGAYYNFTVPWQQETHHVIIISNSTISDFQFNIFNETKAEKTISFNATGKDQAAAFCRVTIPTALVNYTQQEYTVLVDGEAVNTTILPISNSTHTYLYFKYATSTKHIIIIPEIPPQLIPFLLVLATLTITILLKRKHRAQHHTNQQTSQQPSETMNTRSKTGCIPTRHNVHKSDSE